MRVLASYIPDTLSLRAFKNAFKVRVRVCAAWWNHDGPIVVSHVVTNSVSCHVCRLLLGSNESTRYLLSQTFIGRQTRYQGSGS